MAQVHVVVPAGVRDPRRPSGGNTYDVRVGHGLAERGWSVLEHEVPGPWPSPSPAAPDPLATTLAALPANSLVLLDGLVGSAAPDALAAVAHRLRLVLLVHMPLGQAGGDDSFDRERGALAQAAAVLTTSDWTRGWLVDAYGLDPDRVCVARPGADRSDVGPPDPSGRRLLCVGAVSRPKGHDVLAAALATLADLRWRLACVGSLAVDPAAVAEVRRRLHEAGLDRRVRLTGPRVDADLRAAYAAGDLLVLPSRAETYGMAVTDALAAGRPVVASDVGGIPEAMGHGAADRPGLLVPEGDPDALAVALRRWLTEPALRERWRRAAAERRRTLPTWEDTCSDVEAALREAALERAAS